VNLQPAVSNYFHQMPGSTPARVPRLLADNDWPRSVEEQPACFVISDANGQKLAYVYFEEEPGRRSAAKS
jgi:hypothetical protein